MFEKVLDCPKCQKRFNYECDEVIPPFIVCPECYAESPMEEYSAVMICSECRAKLKLPLDLINDPSIACPKCGETIVHGDSNFYDNNASTISIEESASPESKRLLAEGELFDKYRVERLLGYGGMAEVYLTTHLLLKRPCALKLMRRGLLDDPIFIKRFIREAKLANRIDHPNIVRVYDAGNDPKSGLFFLAMEYVEGRTLLEIMQEELPSEAQLWEILSAMADALKVLDDLHVIHRDIKPSNIMLTVDGVYKLMDLGIAKSESDKELGEMTLTIGQTTIGTPAYASPEQCRSAHNVDIRSDIYCLGATLYHLASGKLPFDGNTPVETILKVMQDEAPPLSKLRPDLSYSIIALIQRMMAKNPDDRPSSPDELLQIASSSHSEVDSIFMKVSRFFAAKRKAVMISAALVLAVAAALWIFLGRGDKVDQPAASGRAHITAVERPPVRPPVRSPAPAKVSRGVSETQNRVVKRSAEKPRRPAAYARRRAPVKTPAIREFSDLGTAVLPTAVTLEERFRHISERLSELRNPGQGSKESAAQQKFRKYQIKIRQEQLRRLQAQQKVRERALAIQKKAVSYPATEEFQRKFTEHTTKRSDWGYNSRDIQFAEEMIAMLKTGKVDPNVEVVDGTYKRYSGPLIRSVLSGRIQRSREIVQVLLKLGADASPVTNNKVSLSGLKALTLILLTGGVDRLEGVLLPFARSNQADEKTIADLLLLDHNVTERDAEGNTILHYAAGMGSVKLITWIVALDGDINARNKNGETPLFLATKNGHDQAVTKLLALGADSSIKNNAGKVAAATAVQGHFSSAVKKRNVSAARKYLKEGAEVDMFDSSGDAALHIACRQKDQAMAAMLLASGADPDIKQKRGRRSVPLQLATARSHFSMEIVEMLLKSGADPNVPPQGYGGTTLLHSLCGSWGRRLNEKQQIAFLRLLLASPKIKLTQRYYRNASIFTRALNGRSSLDFIMEFFKHIKTFSAKDPVLNAAILRNYPLDFIRQLILKNADVNAVDNDKTPLWIAVEKKRDDLIKLLLDNGADPNWRNRQGKSIRELGLQ